MSPKVEPPIQKLKLKKNSFIIGYPDKGTHEVIPYHNVLYVWVAEDEMHVVAPLVRETIFKQSDHWIAHMQETHGFYGFEDEDETLWLVNFDKAELIRYYHQHDTWWTNILFEAMDVRIKGKVKYE